MRLKKQVFSDLQEEIRSLKSELEGLKKVHSGSGLNPGLLLIMNNITGIVRECTDALPIA